MWRRRLCWRITFARLRMDPKSSRERAQSGAPSRSDERGGKLWLSRPSGVTSAVERQPYLINAPRSRGNRLGVAQRVFDHGGSDYKQLDKVARGCVDGPPIVNARGAIATLWRRHVDALELDSHRVNGWTTSLWSTFSFR